jgi:hypothetical protein
VTFPPQDCHHLYTAQVESLGGNLYSIDFTDCYTRYSEITFRPKKSDTLREYQDFKTRMKTQHGVSLKILHCDRGTEFCNKKFDRHLAQMGTKRELTVHDTHEQVGVAEHLNQMKVELAHTMLFDAKLPRFLWAEAMNHAIWIKNRAPTRALDGRSPYQVRFGTKPNLSKLVPFGTRAWVKIVKAGKLEPRARPGFFVGFDHDSTGYRIYFPDRRVVKPEREVVFNLEEVSDMVEILGEALSEGERLKYIQPTHLSEENPEPDADAEPAPTSTKSPPPSESELEEEPDEQENPPRRTSGRTRNPPGYYANLNHGSLTANVSEEGEPEEVPLTALLGGLGTEPDSLEEALRGPHAVE